VISITRLTIGQRYQRRIRPHRWRRSPRGAVRAMTIGAPEATSSWAAPRRARRAAGVSGWRGGRRRD